jgi:hypothetical protein
LPNADYLTVEGYFRNNQSFSGNSVYSFEVGGSFVNTATASLPVATSTILGGFTNTGYFSASNSLVFSVGTTTNSGTVILDSLTDLDAAAPFTNSGTFTANGLATLTMSSDFTNTGTMNLPGLSELVLDGGTFSFDGTWNLPDTYDMTINSGGTLTHAENHDTHENDLVLTLNNLTINQGGRINVNGKGYSGGIGNSEDGHGPGGGGVWFGGAGHGGLGGDCDANNNGGAEYGSTTAPTALGSGGVAYSSRDGKAGGGAIKMDISDTFTFNGNITANGVDGIYSSDYHPGGGAGGSIWISANIATGTGEITANGGNGSQYMGSYRSGAGAGGRIALYFDTDNFTGTTTAYGGAGCDNIYGGAGSIYRKSGSQTYGDLVIDNQGNVSPERTIVESRIYCTTLDKSGGRLVGR